MPPDFNARTIDVLSRRAALRCSNPDCGKLTTGPNTAEMRATNIGEAAHIYGARPGAARFRAEMADTERATITNAIWLCSDCHGLIDKDPPRYKPELLLTWKERHEASILAEVGKAGDRIRRVLTDREVAALGLIPLYAEELIREKPNHWEYLLTAELLEHYLKPVMRRARDLELGLITKPRRPLANREVPTWVSNKPVELMQVPKAVQALLRELSAGWGAEGVPGDAALINHVCGLIADAANHLVVIADDAHFTALPSAFAEVARLLAEGALHPLKQFPTISKFIRSIFNEEKPTGEFHYQLVFDLPEDWAESIGAAIALAYESFDPYS